MRSATRSELAAHFWSLARTCSAQQAWRVLDLLEALYAAIWSVHEEALVELCIAALAEEAAADDGEDEASIPF